MSSYFVLPFGACNDRAGNGNLKFRNCFCLTQGENDTQLDTSKAGNSNQGQQTPRRQRDLVEKVSQVAKDSMIHRTASTERERRLESERCWVLHWVGVPLCIDMNAT